MKIVILSRSAAIHSTRRLVLVCRARGHDVQVIDPLRCSIVLGEHHPGLLVRGEPIGPVDIVIPRIGRSITFHGLAVLRQLELGGAYCVNPSQAVARARDKLHTLQVLARHGVDAVPTAVARHPADIRRVIQDLGGAPLVIKPTDGSLGQGVVLAESAAGAKSIIDAFQEVNRSMIVQPFVRGGSDLRLFVVGRRVVAAMRRHAQEDDFRANLHRGGAAEALQPTPAQDRLAIRAARAIGLTLAGVDLIDTPAGPRVLEVNASPGLEGIEAASGRNVALEIVRHAESQARRRGARRARADARA